MREGLEVKICPAPPGEDESRQSAETGTSKTEASKVEASRIEAGETFILCRSSDRAKKEQAMHDRFEKRIEEGLERIVNACQRQKLDAVKVSHRVGRLLGQNTRAAAAFKTTIDVDETSGRAMLKWEKLEDWREWARLSEGCYLLRSNVSGWSAEDLWKAYMQLTEAEGAFRIHKSDLSLRPIWHQKPERVQAHILVCFLAYVLWKTLSQWCKHSGLGDEPRKVLDEIAQVSLVDVVLHTTCGHELRKQCVTTPTQHQQLLLDHLKLSLPTSLASWRL